MKIRSPLRWPRRWLLLVPALLAVVAGVAWWLTAGTPSGSPGQVPPPTSRPPPPSATAAPPEAPKAATEAPDIFALRTWEPPEPPVAPAPPAVAEAPPPAPPPEAPPLPFRYLGKVEEPGRATVIFLARDNQVLAVRPGENIDSAYRVVRLRKDEVFFLYRPLKIEQALPMGSST